MSPGPSRCGVARISPGPPLPRQLLDADRRGDRQCRHSKARLASRHFHRNGVGRGEKTPISSARRGARRHGGKAPQTIMTRKRKTRRSSGDHARSGRRSGQQPRAFRSSLWQTWLYLDWPTAHRSRAGQNFVKAEWIMLHDNPGFSRLRRFSTRRLNRSAPAGGSVPRTFSVGCRTRTFILRRAFVTEPGTPYGTVSPGPITVGARDHGKEAGNGPFPAQSGGDARNIRLEKKLGRHRHVRPGYCLAFGRCCG